MPGDREDVLVAFVREQLAAVLRVASPEQIDRRQRLVDLGLDSLMVVELRNRVEGGLGWKDVLSATLVYDYPSIEALVQFLLARLARMAEGGDDTPASQTSSARPPDLAAAIHEMSDEEAEALLIEKLGTL